MRLRLKTGWKFAQELSAELKKDRVGLISAGIAFYGLLSIFPAIAGITANGGLMTQPAALVGEMQKLGSILPTEASSIIIAQATEIAGSQDEGLGLVAVIGILVSIYAASKAVGAFIEGLHIAAGETDERGFVAGTLFVLSMTLLVIGLAVLALVSTVLVPAFLAALRVEGLFAALVGTLRWPIVGLATALGLGVLYRLSLRHRIEGSLWLTLGALLATFLWLVGSIAFSIYVREFAGYNKTFGTLGVVVSLLMWMWLSSFIVLLGKEVDIMIGDRQTESS